MVQDGTSPRGYCAEGAGGLRRGDLAKPNEASGDPFDPEGAVRVQKDVFGSIIAQESQDLVTQFALQFGFEPILMLVMNDRKVAHLRIPSERRTVSIAPSKY
jgi:hypothetical protein